MEDCEKSCNDLLCAFRRFADHTTAELQTMPRPARVSQRTIDLSVILIDSWDRLARRTYEENEKLRVAQLSVSNSDCPRRWFETVISSNVQHAPNVSKTGNESFMKRRRQVVDSAAEETEVGFHHAAMFKKKSEEMQKILA